LFCWPNSGEAKDGKLQLEFGGGESEGMQPSDDVVLPTDGILESLRNAEGAKYGRLECLLPLDLVVWVKYCGLKLILQVKVLSSIWTKSVSTIPHLTGTFPLMISCSPPCPRAQGYIIDGKAVVGISMEPFTTTFFLAHHYLSLAGRLDVR